MSKTPQKPFKQCIREFNDALDANDFDGLDRVESELDAVLKKRLRRMKYNKYPVRELEELLDELPNDYNTPTVERMLKILENKTPAQMAEEV